MEVNLLFWYSGKETVQATFPANPVYVGETLSNFCRHTPRDIASKLGKRVFAWSAGMSEQKDKQDSPSSEEMLKVLKKMTIDFLREAHPYYSDIKEPENTDFILQFITGILVFYKYNCAPKMFSSIITKGLITHLIGSPYEKVFDDYEQILSGIAKNKGESKPDAELYKMFTTDVFLSFVNAHHLLNTALKDTTFEARGVEGKEILLSHLMAWFAVYYIEKEQGEINPNKPLQHESDSRKYNRIFLDFSNHQERLCRRLSLPKNGEICRFNTIQMAVLTELECILADPFKVGKCAGCNQYFVYAENKHDEFCSEDCRKTFKYWKEKIDAAREALRKEAKLSTPKKNSFTSELSTYFNFATIIEQIHFRCKKRQEFEIYFAIILGAFYAREDKKDNGKGKKTASYTDRDRLVLFLKDKTAKRAETDLFGDTEKKEDFIRYIHETRSLKSEASKIWEKAKKYLTSKEYKKYRYSGNVYTIPKTMRVKSPSQKSYKDAEGGDRQ